MVIFGDLKLLLLIFSLQFCENNTESEEQLS